MLIRRLPTTGTDVYCLQVEMPGKDVDTCVFLRFVILASIVHPWVCDTEVGLGGLASLPIVFKSAIEVGAAESDDGVGASNGPEHARLFES